MNADESFWTYLDRLVAESRLVIDRPRGSRHPRYPEVVYPVDYGYLEGTRSMDGGGIDVWRGSARGSAVQAVICTIDLLKRDAEIKILLDCTDTEMQQIVNLTNSGLLRCILVKRDASGAAGVD